MAKFRKLQLSFLDRVRIRLAEEEMIRRYFKHEIFINNVMRCFPMPF
jgi:hypothetical protein